MANPNRVEPDQHNNYQCRSRKRAPCDRVRIKRGGKSTNRYWLFASGYYAGRMFTGLIEEVGTIVAMRASDHGTQLQIVAPRIAKRAKSGESIAANGCCLTLVSRRGDQLHFDLLRETVRRTNFQKLQRGDSVNLECALVANGRLGGHFVQGHIDCVAAVVNFQKRRADFRLEIELPRKFARYIVPKGAIALNGISLTVAEILPKSFVTWIVPYTKKHTNLDRAQKGDLVNLEFDVLAKYVERMLGR